MLVSYTRYVMTTDVSSALLRRVVNTKLCPEFESERYHPSTKYFIPSGTANAKQRRPRKFEFKNLHITILLLDRAADKIKMVIILSNLSPKNPVPLI